MNATTIRVMGRTRYKVNAKQKVATQMTWVHAILLVMVFASAFSVIYMRDLNRRMFIAYQN